MDIKLKSHKDKTMKDINKKLLDGVSKTMFNSNCLDMDTFLHTVELVVEDEIRERQEHYKLGETTADMIQSVRLGHFDNVTCETNEETNLK